MSYNNIIRLDNLEMMSEEVQNNNSSSIFNYSPVPSGYPFYGCQFTCSCNCNYIETQTIPEPTDRYYIDINTYNVYRLEGNPSDFRMVIEPKTHNPYFVSSSFTGKCEDINWVLIDSIKNYNEYRIKNNGL